MLKIKNYKEFPEMSEETVACIGDVWLDGQPFASFRNDGRGGCNIVHYTAGFKHAAAKLQEMGMLVEEFEQRLDIILPVHKLLGKNDRLVYYNPQSFQYFTAKVNNLANITTQQIEIYRNQATKKGLMILNDF